MSRTEVRVPKYPECWESCGSCAQGEVTVDSVLVSPGQKVVRDDTLILLETGKVALDIPSPVAGVVIEVAVSQYDSIAEGDLIAVIET